MALISKLFWVSFLSNKLYNGTTKGVDKVGQVRMILFTVKISVLEEFQSATRNVWAESFL